MSERSIPWGVTHPSKLNPKPTPPPEKIPTQEELQRFVSNEAEDIAISLIEKHKLPLKVENGRVVDTLKGTELWLRKFITQDEATLFLLECVKKLAKCPDPVLIIGETGTGKETIARAMIGDRSGHIINVNCAGLPEHLIESELFGHKRGAFTGAEMDKEGMCASAKDGVLFLDEIGELPLHVQGKLLRAIEDMNIRRVGSNKEEPITCKFVCATNRDIKRMVDEKTFRQDLYARIGTFELHIKPLRERTGDIEPIIRSVKGGDELLRGMTERGIALSQLNLEHNVRSIIQYVRRYSVLGTILV